MCSELTYALAHRASRPTTAAERKPIVGCDRQATYLHPGQLFASKGPWTVTTVLGSCVSVCLFDSSTGLGGINHFVLPLDVTTREGSARFALPAIDLLIEEMRRNGADLKRMHAKLFGGASVMAAFSHREAIGEKNIEAARRRLADHAIPIVGQDAGGTRARKLMYETDRGTAWIRSI